MRGSTPGARATATKVVALVAGLALAVPLAGCGPRANQQDTSGTTSQQPDGAATSPAALPLDPAAIEGALDQVDQALNAVDAALTEADASAPDSD